MAVGAAVEGVVRAVERTRRRAAMTHATSADAHHATGVTSASACEVTGTPAASSAAAMARACSAERTSTAICA